MDYIKRTMLEQAEYNLFVDEIKVHENEMNKKAIQNAKIERLLLHAENSEQVMQNQLREINKLESKNKIFKGLTIGGVTVSVALLIAMFVK